MRLQPCEGDSRFSVRCIICEQWGVFNTMVADLDGPAYKAYYCQKCRPRPDLYGPRKKEEVNCGI